MSSPYLNLPIRNEAEVRLSMLDVIKAGVNSNLRGCPDCGDPAAIDPSFHGQVCIYCNNDHCPQTSGDGWPQAMGKTFAEAAAKWNTRT